MNFSFPNFVHFTAQQCFRYLSFFYFINFFFCKKINGIFSVFFLSLNWLQSMWREEKCWRKSGRKSLTPKQNEREKKLKQTQPIYNATKVILFTIFISRCLRHGTHTLSTTLFFLPVASVPRAAFIHIQLKRFAAANRKDDDAAEKRERQSVGMECVFTVYRQLWGRTDLVQVFGDLFLSHPRLSRL